jgi:hypothetical protein
MNFTGSRSKPKQRQADPTHDENRAANRDNIGCRSYEFDG